MDVSLLHIKKRIALFWKRTEWPSVTLSIRQILISFTLEKLTLILKGKQEEFERSWGPFTAVKYMDLSDDEEENPIL